MLRSLPYKKSTFLERLRQPNGLDGSREDSRGYWNSLENLHFAVNYPKKSKMAKTFNNALIAPIHKET